MAARRTRHAPAAAPTPIPALAPIESPETGDGAGVLVTRVGAPVLVDAMLEVLEVLEVLDAVGNMLEAATAVDGAAV